MDKRQKLFEAIKNITNYSCLNSELDDIINAVNQTQPPIKINGELVLEIYSKTDWINKCPERLPKHRAAENLLFVDTEGNVLTIGEDFTNATKKNTYPVKVYHLKRTSHEKNSN